MFDYTGWEKNTFGYHGDDGHKFFSTGNGQQYGPTFTTGDVIGCGINLINSSCFYTKNGIHLGEAFRELPDQPLYPTVGLQTPNEELLANFGQQDFKFDFEDYLKEWRCKAQKDIEQRALENQNILGSVNEIVQGYLVHHGFVGSIEAFHEEGGTNACSESLESIKNRQMIKKLIFSGKISDAIATVDRLFPGVLDEDFNLKFMLQVRQFIEMVNGVDRLNGKEKKVGNNVIAVDEMVVDQCEPMSTDEYLSEEQIKCPKVKNGNNNGDSVVDFNGSCNKNVKKICGGKVKGLKDMLQFGRDLLMNLTKQRDMQQQQQDAGDNTVNKQMYKRNKSMLQEAYSLLAYTDPANSPVGYQLEAAQREPVFAQLNSAILKSQGLPVKPPVNTLIGQTTLCLKTMLKHKMGEAAFVNVSDYFC